jgi:ankyrin repeat protein
LTESEARVILAIGNEKANAIWEAGTANQKGWEKPKADATRKAREEWIKSKYLWRGFLAYNDDDGKTHVEREEKYCRDMYESARKCEILGIASALAHGAVAGWHNEAEEGRTSLHTCCLYKIEEPESEWKSIECAELLLQNGAKIDSKDKLAHGALDCALLGNADRQMIEYLSKKVS